MTVLSKGGHRNSKNASDNDICAWPGLLSITKKNKEKKSNKLFHSTRNQGKYS